MLYQGRYDKNKPSGEAAWKALNFTLAAAPKAGVVSSAMLNNMVSYRLLLTHGPKSKNGMPAKKQMVRKSRPQPNLALSTVAPNLMSQLQTTNGQQRSLAPSSQTTGKSTAALLLSKSQLLKTGRPKQLPTLLHPTSVETASTQT